MLQPKESRNLKRSYKRLAIFLIMALIFDSFIAFLLFKYTKISEVLCGFFIIVITTLLYLIFLLVCAKIDKRKQAKIEKEGKKDPFSHN